MPEDQSKSIAAPSQFSAGPHHWIFESCADCVMVLDGGGDVMVVNGNGMRALGIEDPSTVLYQPLGRLWRSARQDAVAAALEQARGGGVGRFTSSAPASSGRPRWWDVTVTRIDGSGGMLEGLLALARDVTGVRQADQQLHRSEARYRSLVAAANVIEWDMPANGQFETVQAAWSTFTGQRFDQYCGAGWLDAVHPDDRARSERTWAAALRRRHAYVGEQRLRRVDGVYHHMLVRAVPVIESDGSLREWIGVHIDVEDRRGAEERLRLLDAMSEATRNADDAKSVMAVTTRMLGQHLGVTRCPYAEVATDNDHFHIRYDWVTDGAVSTVGDYSLDLFGARAANSMRAGQTLLIRDVDRELAHGEGQGEGEDPGVAMFNAIDCKAIICCPLIKEGKLVAMMAVHQNRPRNWTLDEVALVEEVVERCWVHIERVRASEALREADRHKSEFLATLAHELRNPLAPVRNGLEIMKLAAGDPAAMASVRAMMERQVSHMVHLINDLLDIARVSSGKLVLKKEYAELKTLVASAVETSQPLLDAAGQTLTVRLPEAAAIVEVDVVRISQVLSNLLSNAAKYTPADGHIDITARVTDRQLLIEVADDGIGIAPESIESVFEMFTQVGRSIANAKGGLGIGLSLVRRLVELHGGTVSAASAGIGRGSTFTVCLPLAALDGASLPPTPSTAVEPSPATRLRVLITDDNRDAADTLSDLLLNDGHDTRVAYDGAGALAVAAEFRPDVVLLDIGMPGMDGYETARAMRRLPGLEHVTLAALTGWGAAEDRARSRAAGFDHHLLKPIVLAELQALLRQPTSPSAG